MNIKKFNTTVQYAAPTAKDLVIVAPFMDTLVGAIVSGESCKLEVSTSNHLLGQADREAITRLFLTLTEAGFTSGHDEDAFRALEKIENHQECKERWR